MAKAKKKTVKTVVKKAVKKVRCAGKTSEGKQCKRMVQPPAKTCHLHKGKKK